MGLHNVIVRVYPPGRRCNECRKLLSIYNEGPKCYFHSLDKKTQKDLNKEAPSPEPFCLCGSGPVGIAAQLTFMRYDGYVD